MTNDKESPSVEFARVLKIAAFCGSAVGADVANPKYRVNVLTFGVWICIIGYFVCTFYSAYKTSREDWKKLLQVFCMMPGGIQGMVKLTSGVCYTKRVSAIVVGLKKLYVKFEQKGDNYSKALYKSCDRQRIILKIFIIIYTISMLGVIVVPGIMLIVNGKRYLMMNFLIPGVDPNTDIGYYTTQSLHTLFMTCGAFGLFTGDLYFLILSAQCYCFVDVFALKVEYFNDIVLKSKQKNRLNELCKLIEWHQFYIAYTLEVNEVFKYIVSTCVGTSSFSILCCMFIITAGVASEWPGVYPFIVLAASALYVYCIWGTQINNCHDNFYNIICNITWYELSPSMQKMIVQQIFKAQNPKQIMVAGFMPLSVNTALQITKTIYSILMMILQFAEE